MANAAREESMEDVLASIRRLVSEETERMPDMREAVAAQPIEPDAPEDMVLGPEDDDVPEPEVASEAPPSRAARAKLLLTDDYLVEDMERWPEEDAAAPKPPVVTAKSDRPSGQPPRAETRSQVARSRRAFADEAQDKIADDIDDFLSGEEDAAKPVAVAPIAPQPERPSLDERARARQERAEQRRQAAARAAAIASETAVRRAPKPMATPTPTPEPVAVQPKPEGKPAPAPDTTALAEPQMVPLSMIEMAVRSSLEQYTSELVPQAAPETDAEVVLDEDMLREMVSDIVRKELQGSLGERITRNVRKLVRREIYRALETRDLG